MRKDACEGILPFVIKIMYICPENLKGTQWKTIPLYSMLIIKTSTSPVTLANLTHYQFKVLQTTHF